MKKIFILLIPILFLTCDEDNPVASDTTAPTVTITYPANGSMLSAETTISVNVVDDSDIASVVFFVNGSEVFTDTEVPYEYSWDVCALTEENATILVNATDSAGNVGVSSLLSHAVDGSYDCNGDCGGVYNYADEICGSCSVYLWGECYNIEDTTSLYGNNLSGEIPSSIGNLTNLQYLRLVNKNLSGSIPSEIGNLTNLIELDLSENEFSGSIPSEIGNLTNLTLLGLYDNNLSGEIPSSIGNLTNLQYLWLNDNNLSGEIPSSIGNLTNLQSFYINYNQLTGVIPSGLCSHGGIENSDIGNNNLCPPYPYCLFQLFLWQQDTSNCP